MTDEEFEEYDPFTALDELVKEGISLEDLKIIQSRIHKISDDITLYDLDDKEN